MQMRSGAISEQDKRTTDKGNKADKSDDQISLPGLRKNEGLFSCAEEAGVCTEMAESTRMSLGSGISFVGNEEGETEAS